jgi:acyl carrier protein
MRYLKINHSFQMEKSVVYTSYTDLKQLSLSITEFVAEKSDVGIEDMTFKTSLLNDLGVDGDDAAELLEAFMEKYKVDFSEFEFLAYFDTEGFPITSLPIILFRLVGFLAFSLLFPIELIIRDIYWLINPKIQVYPLTKTIFESNRSSNLKSLTLGDLIASAHQGKFTKRENIHFVLSPVQLFG